MSQENADGRPRIPTWVFDSGVESSFRTLDYSIAVISTPHGRVGLYTNPTDRRCYSLIVRTLVPTADQMILNQLHSLEESLAVGMAVAVLKQVLFRRTGLFVQSLHLGNNSMRSTTEGDVGLGNAHEPYFYHVHLLARGDPVRSYFDGAPELAGPPLGVAFRPQDGNHARPTDVETAAIVRGFRRVLMESRPHDTIWEYSGCSVDTIR